MSMIGEMHSEMNAKKLENIILNPLIEKEFENK